MMMKFQNYFKFTKFISLSTRSARLWKTFQASNAIIELLKNNKKIAVTANSHKVIHNLLERVENLANNQNYVFKD